MRLNFNILWFEDTLEITAGIIEPVEEHLEDQGYYLKIVDILKDSKKLDEIIKDVNEKKLDVDLILMDYNLAGGEKGDQLIETIRKGNLLTDIIFYSEDSQFRNVIGALDGAYLTNREHLEDKVLAVVNHILRKSLDLSNLRGLVMAETSELDELMFQIVQYFLDEDIFQETNSKKNKIKKKFIDSTKSSLKKIEGINIDGTSGTQELLLEVGAYHRARAVTRLVGDVENNNAKLKVIADNIGDLKLDANDYCDEIIKLRNLLAHVKEEQSQDGQKILKSIRKGEDFIFDEDKALAARKTLKKYFTILSGIYKAVTGKEWDN